MLALGIIVALWRSENKRGRVREFLLLSCVVCAVFLYFKLVQTRS